MRSKEIVLTGASAGIGAAAAIELTRRGHRVHALGRSREKLERVHLAMVRTAPGVVDVPRPLTADFSALRDVTAVAAELIDRCPRLDVLVNNAGMEAHRRELSPDGFELTFAVNHLAPFLLTSRLSERLQASGGRMIVTASSNHAEGELNIEDLQLESGWSTSRAYDCSKLANVLFTAEFVRRTGLEAMSFHPGSISTDLNRDARFSRLFKPIEKIFYGSPRKGAQTLVWLASEPEGALPKSIYYVDCAPAEPSAAAQDPHLAATLWERSERLISGALSDSTGKARS